MLVIRCLEHGSYRHGSVIAVRNDHCSPADFPLIVCHQPSAKKYNVDDFQFSQAYPMFYDHLNKANVFLENIIDLAEEKLDSRIINDLISDPVEGQSLPLC